MSDSPAVFAYSIMLGMAIGLVLSMGFVLALFLWDYKNDK